MKSIEAENLTRSFGERVAFDGLTFAVDQGEIFGLLGPNGAGKTTTIRMLTCQLMPTAGTARLLGHDVRREASRVKPLIGVAFEEQNLYERMSGRENLEFGGVLHGERLQAGHGSRLRSGKLQVGGAAQDPATDN